MQVMNKTILAAFLVLVIPVLAEGAETERRSVEQFDKLHVSGLLNVRLVEGSGNTVTVTVEGTGLDEVITEVEGKTLSVKMKHGILYDENEIEVQVDISYNIVRDILVTTGSTVTSATELRGDKITIETNAGGDAVLGLNVTTVDLKSASGGKLTVSGNTQSQDTIVNTGGILNAFDLNCSRTYIRVNTGGVAEVTVTQELEAQVGTGGTLRYQGAPPEKTIKKGLGATVKEVKSERLSL
jgi:hypothetical protein